MQNNADVEFQEILLVVKGFEGGKANHPRDKGGKTNFGITQPTYDDYQQRAIGKNQQPILQKQVFDLTYDEAVEFYKWLYYSNKSELFVDKNTRLIYFDCLVNHGLGNIIKLINRSCNLQENSISKVLIQKVNGQNQQEFQSKLLNEREKFYHEIVAKDETQSVFLNGWINRVNKLRAIVKVK